MFSDTREESPGEERVLSVRACLLDSRGVGSDPDSGHVSGLPNL